jgi:protein-L-isoaspartate(D-aspartate) O-methyltransferase
MDDGNRMRRDRMVARQIEARGIRDVRLLQAMREVPREAFVPERLTEFAWDDGPLPIGEGQTISQPYIVAAMVEAAEVKAVRPRARGRRGLGYAAAVPLDLACRVFTIERHEPLAAAAGERLTRLGYRQRHRDAGDGSGGLPDEAPFDAITRRRACPTCRRRSNASCRWWRLVIPVGGEEVQALCRVTRRRR